MKMREKIKRFWTMDVHSHEGFTLVELIIVIAILAILSSVAVVGYSSYIEKANKSADEALLYEINLAFQSACVMAGVNIAEINTAEFSIETMLVTSVEGNTQHPAVALFDDYFDVSNAKFKVVEDVRWNAKLDKFVDANGDEGYTMSYGGGYVTLNASDIAALKDSTFITEMTLSGLLTKVDEVTDYATAMLGVGAFDKILESPEFQKSAALALGLDPNSDTLLADMYTEVDRLANQIVAQSDGKIDYDTAFAQVQANSMVLFAAQNAVNTDVMTTDTITELFASDTAKDTIKNNLSNDTGLAMSQAALAYGMYTAYVNQLPDDYVNPTTEQTKAEMLTETSDALSIMDKLSDDGFQAYIQDAETGQKDLEAYLAALEMINSSTNDTAAVEHLVVNGFNNDELYEMLKAAMGLED